MFDWLFLLAAFAGGMFGAAVGAIPAFILTGLAAAVGAGIAIVTGDDTLIGAIAFGPFLGPHVAFAGGVAGAAYAKKVGKLDDGKNILSALAGLNAPDVLLVGGLFGALGYLIDWLYRFIPNIGEAAWTDTIALSVVTTAIIVRFVFGHSGLFGQVPAGHSRWVASDKGGWIPWQSKPLQLLAIAMAFGFTAVYLTFIYADMPGGGAMPILFWGISAFSLVFLQFGTQVPITHHITLPAGLAVLASGDIWWGMAFAVLGIFIGEAAASIFTSYGDTHIDPPAASIATTTTLLAVFSAVGLMAVSGVGALVIALVVAGVGYGLFTWLQKEPATVPAAAD